MKKNFVFVVAILALTAFTIGVVSITQQLSAQTVPEGDKPKETDKPSIDKEMLDKVEKEFNKAVEEFEKEEHSEKPAFAELGIPEWWMNPPEFENHIVFGRGYAIFDNLEGLQEAKDHADRNARYDINAKLTGRLYMIEESDDIEFYDSGYMSAKNLRVLNTEIVRHEDRYAYFVILTYSFYSHVLKEMDPKYVNEIKETLDLMEKFGAFNREKMDPIAIMRVVTKLRDGIPRIGNPVSGFESKEEKEKRLEQTKLENAAPLCVIASQIFEKGTEFDAMKKVTIDSAIEMLSKKTKDVAYGTLLDYANKYDICVSPPLFEKSIRESSLFDIDLDNVLIVTLEYKQLFDESTNMKIEARLSAEEFVKRLVSYMKETGMNPDSSKMEYLKSVAIRNMKRVK